eukprot:g16740.t1
MSGAPGASSDRNLPSTAPLLQRPLISGPLFGLDALGQGIPAAAKAVPAIASTPTAADPSHRNNRGVWLSKSPLWEPTDGRFLPPPPPPLNLGSTTKASAAPDPPPADVWGEAPEEAAARDVWQRYVDQTSRDKVSADRGDVDHDDDSSEANSLYDGFELLDQYGGPVRRPEAGVPVDNTSNDVQRAGALQPQEEGAAAGAGQNKMGKQDYFALTAPPVHPSLARYESRCLLRFALTSTEKRLFAEKRKGRCTHSLIDDANYEEPSYVRNEWLDGIPVSTSSSSARIKSPRNNHAPRLLTFRGSGVIGTLPHTAQPTLEPRRFNLDVTWLGKVTHVLASESCSGSIAAGTKKPTGQAAASRTGAAKNNPGVAGASTTECSLARPDAFATLVEHSSRVPLVLPSRGMQYNIVEVELSNKASKDRDQCFVPQLFGGKLIRRRAGFSGAGGGAEKEAPSSTLSLLQTNAGQVPLEAIGIEESAQEVEHHHHFNPVFEAPPIKGRQRTREDIKGLRSLFYLPPEPSTWPAFVGTYVRDRQSFRTGVVVEIVEDKADLERRKEHERRKMKAGVQPIDHLLPKPIPRVLFNTGELEEAQAFRHADLFLKATTHTTHNKKPSKPRPLTHDRQMISSQTSNLYCFQLPDSKLFLTRVTPQLFLQPVRRLFYACDAALEPVFALGSSSNIMKRDQLVSRELLTDGDRQSQAILRLLKSLQSSRCIEQQNKEALAKFEQSVQKLAHCAAAFYGEDFLPRIVESGGSLKAPPARFGGGSYRNLAGQVVTNPGMEQGDSAPVILALERKDTLFDYYELGKRTSSRINSENACSRQACVDWVFHLVKKGLGFLVHAKAHAFDQRLLKGLQTMEVLEEHYARNAAEAAASAMPTSAANIRWRLVPPARYILDKLQRAPWMQAAEYQQVLEQGYTFLINPRVSDSDSDFPCRVDKYQKLPLASQDDRALLLAAIGGRKIDGKEIARYFRAIG